MTIPTQSPYHSLPPIGFLIAFTPDALAFLILPKVVKATSSFFGHRTHPQPEEKSKTFFNFNTNPRHPSSPLPPSPQSGENSKAEMMGYLAGTLIWHTINVFIAGTTLPTILSLAPVTILIDMVTGIAESSFLYYRGLPNHGVAYNKCFISPMKQLAFALPALLTMSKISLLMNRCLLNRCLPNWVSVGIACQLGKIIGIKAMNRTPKFSLFNNKTTNWTNYLNTQINCLKKIHPNDRNANEIYIEFRNHVLQNKHPITLLGLQENFSEKDLKIRVRQLSFSLHPDKNPNRLEEAKILFQILKEAEKTLL